MKRILFATDGSKSADKAGQMAASLLAAYPEAEIVVLYVSLDLAFPYDMGNESYMDIEQGRAAEIERTAMESLFGEAAGRVRFRHEVGRAPSVVCDVAEQEDADLVVIGSHGHGTVDRLFLGSVSYGVLQRSNRPVLVVKGA